MFFKIIWDDSNRKPNTIWVDKGSEFYNRLEKSWFQDDDIQKRIQQIMKKDLQLLKELLEP